ncbi:MAG TPA: hypothetical protein VGO62_11635, partial [Myxococcota bacterium]
MSDLGINVDDERSLLAVHDFTALHERLDTSLRRRAVFASATVAAFVALLAASAALLHVPA